MTDEGYLLLATGDTRYLDMARNLAASIRVMDGTRRICLVHDEGYQAKSVDRRLFDDYAILEDDPLYPGFMNKIRLFSVSPYARAMFVDADCLLLKRDISIYWDAARPFPFATTGAPCISGEWKGVDVAKLLKQEGATYLVKICSGVFCFDKSPEAKEFFSGLKDYYLRRRDFLGIGLHRGKPAQTDEIYIGLWMGLTGIGACIDNFGENSWSVSTWRAFWLSLDPTLGSATLRKPKHSIRGIPNPMGGWDRLSPSLVHFVGLKPRRAYQRMAAYFQTRLALPER